MGRASSNKKVSRAASTGGGRTARGRTPILWYGTLFVFVAVGVLTVFASASNLRKTAADDTPPRVGKDHWHAAYGIFICDSWVPPMSDAHGDRTGIHSHGDGLIHTHPAIRSAGGTGATLGKFFDEVDAKATATSIKVPKATGAKRLEVKNGDKCGTKSGKVKARIFKNQADQEGEELRGDPSKWRIQNGEIVVVAFVSEGTKIEPPPSVANLADPGDLPGSTPQTAPIPTTPTSQGSPTTASPSATTTP